MMLGQEKSSQSGIIVSAIAHHAIANRSQARMDRDLARVCSSGMAYEFWWNFQREKTRKRSSKGPTRCLDDDRLNGNGWWREAGQ